MSSLEQEKKEIRALFPGEDFYALIEDNLTYTFVKPPDNIAYETIYIHKPEEETESEDEDEVPRLIEPSVSEEELKDFARKRREHMGWDFQPPSSCSEDEEDSMETYICTCDICERAFYESDKMKDEPMPMNYENEKLGDCIACWKCYTGETNGEEMWKTDENEQNEDDIKEIKEEKDRLIKIMIEDDNKSKITNL